MASNANKNHIAAISRVTNAAFSFLIAAAVLVAPRTVKADNGGLSSKPQTVEYKKRISGDSWNGYIKNLIVRVSGRKIEPIVYDYRNALNVFSGSYPAIAIRACPVESGYWGGEQCITADGPYILIPESVELNTLRFDVKYRVVGVRKQEGQIEDVTFEFAKISQPTAPPKKPLKPSER